MLGEEVHLCVLRALAVDETPAERAEHALDLQLLDSLSWPVFVWEWLRLTDDPLLENLWAHRLAQQQSGNPAASLAGTARGASATPPRRKAFEPLPDQAASSIAL